MEKGIYRITWRQSGKLYKKLIKRYHLSSVDGSPCNICLVNSMCRKSFLDGSACDLFSKFVDKYIEEKNENKNRSCNQ
jgi:hypothetical protein